MKSYRYSSNIFVTFFYLYFIGSVCLDDYLTDLSMASLLFASTGFGDGCSAGGYPTNCKKHKQKFFYISIHKPPASIEFAPIKQVLAVTVEPFKLVGVAYELSQRRKL